MPEPEVGKRPQSAAPVNALETKLTRRPKAVKEAEGDSSPDLRDVLVPNQKCLVTKISEINP
jgi:hypothetical protein